MLPEAFGTFCHFEQDETPILTPPDSTEKSVNPRAVCSSLLLTSGTVRWCLSNLAFFADCFSEECRSVIQEQAASLGLAMFSLLVQRCTCLLKDSAKGNQQDPRPLGFAVVQPCPDEP